MKKLHCSIFWTKMNSKTLITLQDEPYFCLFFRSPVDNWRAINQVSLCILLELKKKYVASFTDWFYSSPHVSTHQWQVWSINLIPLTDYFKQREKLIHMHLYKSFNISIFHIFNLYKDIYLVSTIKNNELIYLLILELGIY